MYYYFLAQSGYIVRTTEDPTAQPPFGWTLYESELPNLAGAYIDPDGVISMPLPQIDYGQSKSHRTDNTVMQNFYDTPLYKKARIKANKDPLLAFQVTVALNAEQRQDARATNGAISAVRAILRKRHGYNDQAS